MVDSVHSQGSIGVSAEIVNCEFDLYYCKIKSETRKGGRDATHMLPLRPIYRSGTKGKEMLIKGCGMDENEVVLTRVKVESGILLYFTRLS